MTSRSLEQTSPYIHQIDTGFVPPVLPSASEMQLNCTEATWVTCPLLHVKLCTEQTTVFKFLGWNDSGKCFRTPCKVFHSADGQRLDVYFKNNQRFCSKQVSHLTWIQISMYFTCWRKKVQKYKQEVKAAAVKTSSSSSEKKLMWSLCPWVSEYRQKPSIKTDDTFEPLKLKVFE